VIRSACQQFHAAGRKVDNLALTGKVTAESLRKEAVHVFNGNPAHCDTLYQIAKGAEGAPKADTFKFEQAFDYISQKPILRCILESSLAAAATTPSRMRNIEVAGSDGEVGGGDVRVEKPADESQARPVGVKSAQQAKRAQSGHAVNVSAVSNAIANMSGALTTFNEANNKRGKKSAEATAMKQTMVRADVESKMFAAYNSLCQNGSCLAMGSADRKRMVRAMADRIFKWLNFEESTTYGAVPSFAESNPV
jgi:hypothetical protein